MSITGYDTTSSTLSLACYHLAMHPEVQDKARAEVDAIAEALEEDGGRELAYEDMAKMEYIDMVISETLR